MNEDSLDSCGLDFFPLNLIIYILHNFMDLKFTASRFDALIYTKIQAQKIILIISHCLKYTLEWLFQCREKVLPNLQQWTYFYSCTVHVSSRCPTLGLTLHTPLQTDSLQTSSPPLPPHPDASWSCAAAGPRRAVQRTGETPPSAG